MKNENELNKFINQLSKEASLPRLDFEAKLKNKILNKNRSSFKHSFNLALDQFFFSLKGMPFTNFGLLTAMVLFIGVSLGAVAVYQMNQGESDLLQVNQVSAQESYLVLNNVLKNNSLTLTSSLAQNSLLAEMLAQPSQNEANLTKSISIQNASQESIPARLYNFFQTTIQKEPGPLAVNCKGIATDNVRIETYEYSMDTANTNSSQNFLKVQNFDSDNSLYSMFITDNTGLTEFIAGNSYAVFTKTNSANTSIQATSLPEVSASQGQLDQVYGSDVDVRKITKNGLVYYQLISKTSNKSVSLCSGNTSTNGTSDNTEFTSPWGELVYIVHTVDPRNDYQIIETYYYLGEISAKKLILKSTYTIAKANLTPENAIAKYFLFDQPVKVWNKEDLPENPVNNAPALDIP